MISTCELASCVRRRPCSRKISCSRSQFALRHSRRSSLKSFEPSSKRLEYESTVPRETSPLRDTTSSCGKWTLYISCPTSWCFLPRHELGSSESLEVCPPASVRRAPLHLIPLAALSEEARSTHSPEHLTHGSTPVWGVVPTAQSRYQTTIQGSLGP